MMEGVHILLALALVILFIKDPDHISYLIAALGAAIPMTDRFLFNSLIEIGFLGPMWEHRSVTHSLFSAIIFVMIAWYLGYPKEGAIGYGAHLIPDMFLGGVMLFFPISLSVYGDNWLPTFLTNAVVALLSGIVIIWHILNEEYNLHSFLTNHFENQ